MTTPTDRADPSNRPPGPLSRPANSPYTTRQARFDTDGMKIETPPVEATLTEYGLQVDCRIPRRELAMPTSEAFVDDRLDPRAGAETGQQRLLFPTSDPAQRTLKGKLASLWFLIEE